MTEWLTFLVTNYLPRKYATRFIGWFSRIEQPWVRDLSMLLWRLFTDGPDLSEAKQTTFRSLHDCFIRELKEDARPVDARPHVLISPCDAEIGATGTINEGMALQIKGSRYRISDLLAGAVDSDGLDGGTFITLRLKSTMYHRFHAPADGAVDCIRFIPGDFWNVHPPALRRVERLFCRNERGVIPFQVEGATIVLVPIAAILVASLKLHALPEPLDMNYEGPVDIPLGVRYRKGEQVGYFQHGSTIVVLAPRGFRLAPTVSTGHLIRMGQPLLTIQESDVGVRM